MLNCLPALRDSSNLVSREGFEPTTPWLKVMLSNSRFSGRFYSWNRLKISSIFNESGWQAAPKYSRPDFAGPLLFVIPQRANFLEFNPPLSGQRVYQTSSFGNRKLQFTFAEFRKSDVVLKRSIFLSKVIQSGLLCSEQPGSYWSLPPQGFRARLALSPG